MCMNSTQSFPTFHSQTLSVSLKCSGGCQNTKEAAVGSTHPRVHPNQTDLRERRVLGLVVLGKAVESASEMGNSRGKWARLGAADSHQGTLALGPGQEVVLGLVLELNGYNRSI